MRRFKHRLVTLGLLLCVVHVWTERTCGTEFTDPASSALLADIIVEGRPRSLPETGDVYNVSVQVRSVKKGAELLNGGKKPKRITVGPLGKENKQDCVGEVVAKKKYIFFLRTQNGGKNYLVISALPIKSQKRTNRVIKKIICKKCAKSPAVRKIKNKSVDEGKTLKLKCSAKAKPNPKFQWFKDGSPLKSKKGTLRIKDRRNGSRLQIIKASKKDAGQYVCQASNAQGQANVTVKVRVKSGLKHARCKQQTFCLNGGTCRYMASLDKEFCECPEKWAGSRCELRDLISVGPEYNRQATLLHDRTIIFISIAIAALVFIAICIISYFLAKQKRKEWETRQKNKKNKHIPSNTDTYRQPLLLDEIDGPHSPRRNVHMVRETCTQTDSDTYYYSDPNVYPIINPHQNAPIYEPSIEMRRQAQPLGAAPHPGSGPDRISRASSQGSRKRLKALSLDDDRVNEEDLDQPGMNEINCIPMRVLPRNSYSDGNIKGGARHGNRRAPPSSMQNMDIPEGEFDNVKPVNAEAPVVIDLRSSSPSVRVPDEQDDAVRPYDGAPSEDAIENQQPPKYEELPESRKAYRSYNSDSDEEATERSPLTRLHISEDEEDPMLRQNPPRDKSFDSLDLNKSDSQPTMESVVSDPGTRDSRNDGEPLYANNPDSYSSSVTGSPDSHPSSSMENLVIPVLRNGTETGLSWDEHGMPVSPGHNSFPPLSITDSQNLEDQFIHPQPPNELPLSPSKNSAVYQKLLKDIREDQDPIPI